MYLPSLEDEDVRKKTVFIQKPETTARPDWLASALRSASRSIRRRSDDVRLLGLSIAYEHIGDEGCSLVASELLDPRPKSSTTAAKTSNSNSNSGTITSTGNANSISSSSKAHPANMIYSLDLTECGIQDAGASALADALVHNKFLVHLNLSYNRIGNPGALKLLGALAKNTTLLSLTLHNHAISDQSLLDRIHEALKHNHEQKVQVLKNHSEQLRIRKNTVVNTAHMEPLQSSPNPPVAPTPPLDLPEPDPWTVIANLRNQVNQLSLENSNLRDKVLFIESREQQSQSQKDLYFEWPSNEPSSASSSSYLLS